MGEREAGYSADMPSLKRIIYVCLQHACTWTSVVSERDTGAGAVGNSKPGRDKMMRAPVHAELGRQPKEDRLCPDAAGQRGLNCAWVAETQSAMLRFTAELSEPGG